VLLGGSVVIIYALNIIFFLFGMMMVFLVFRSAYKVALGIYRLFK
jgi:hypothetical protein